PISLQQLVLAMDEECAVAAEEGGIDARSIAQFDAWLLERPEHLDQVLPEPKGVVVLVPRRQSKDYGDPWTNRAAQEADRQSYFLIRNGERLYRICTDFIVGTTLLPRRDEFLDFFVDERVDWDTRERTRVALEPGSRAYMEAEKRADARGRHYFRIGLILQGLIDRTPVFHPLPGAIQVTRPEAYDRGWLRIIADAEPALGDGHERFRDWHARLNATLDVGMRVIGTFSGWSGDYASFRSLADKHGHPRLSPATASYPRDNELYRLEGKRDGGFFFLYARAGDEVYDPYEGWRAPKLRAACVVHPDDRFILAYDAATVEEMEYYLRSRQDRQAYVQMFPLLKAAIRMKWEEAAAEAPFRQLLSGEIVKAHRVDFVDAEAAVPDLVRWYKFKNKNHRPLVGDDEGKALRMIVAEFAVRLRERDNRERRAQRGEFARMTRMALEQWPQALLVAHKSANAYVTLVPHNAEPVYVEEITFTPTGVRERKPWRTVDTRSQRWHLLHTSERWAGWQIGASHWEHLTDPEIAELGPVARRLAEQADARRSGQGGRRDPDAVGLMAVCFDRDDNAFHVYILAREAVIPAAQPLSGALQDVRVEVDACTWSRAANGTVGLTSAGREGTGWEGGALPWEAGVYRRSTAWSRSLRQRAEVVLEQDAAVIARAQAAHAAYAAARQERERLAALVRKAEQALAQGWLAREEARRYSAFLAEYGDPELWEGHQKTLPKLAYLYHRHRGLVTMLEHLVERGVAIDGLTFGEARRCYQEGVSTHGVVDAWGCRGTTLPDDLDDLVLATDVKG
ncbi:MAG TPA: hypothetical protein VLA19_15945, partial [Herpetosiphonaceae bacterium]|nr:hypothetical protein [Herpetosiphonaceae bacterium]